VNNRAIYVSTRYSADRAACGSAINSPSEPAARPTFVASPKVQLIGYAQPGATFAFGINNAGQIAGYYSDHNGATHGFLVLKVGVGSAVSASLARQIENAVDCPDRVEGAGVAALERHLARPVVVDPVLVA